MKSSLTIAGLIASLAFACGGAPDPESATNESDLTSTARKEGDKCGGFTPNPEGCDVGLECVFNTPFIPDAPGTCMKKVVLAQEGEWCGGFRPNPARCAEGLICFVSNTQVTDAPGKCVKQVVAKKGERCGGFTANPLKCNKGLRCEQSNVNTDFPGTCVEETPLD